MTIPRAAILAVLLSTITQPPWASAANLADVEYVQRAKEYRESGRLQAAVIELKNALQRSPQNAEARLLLGEAYIELGQGANAEKELRRAAELGRAAPVALGKALLLQGKSAELLEEIEPSPGLPPEQRAEIHALRGEAHLAERKPDEASRDFDAALAAHPASVPALLGRARLALAKGDATQARNRIEQSLQRSPASAPAWSMLGDLEQSQGKQRQAEQAYSKAMEHGAAHSAIQLKRALVRIALKDLDGAASDLAAVKRVARDHPGVHYAEGLLQFRRRAYAEALGPFEKLLAAVPGHQPGTFYLGATHLALNHFEQAEQHLNRVLAAAPKSDDAARLLGHTHLYRRDYARAEQVLAPLVKRSPNDALALQALGKALLAQGKRKEGSAYLERAAVLQPKSAEAKIDVALSHLSVGERELALEELEAATALDPESVRAEMLLVRERFRAGKFDEALAVIERLRKKRPDSPDPLVLKGMAYGGRGDLTQARGAFEQALRLQPGNPSACANLAALALKAGDAQKARGYYEQALRHNPGHEGTLLGLASFEAQQGNQSAQFARLEEAVRRNPKSLRPRLALARTLLSEKEPLKAMAALTEAREAYGEHPAFLAVLGEAQLAAGQTASAIGTYRKLVSVQPKSAEAHYLLASTHAVNKDASGLREALLKGLRLQPNHPLAARLMGQFIALAPNAQEADKRLAELKQAQPENPLVMDLEGQLALKRKQPAKAVAIYKTARERYPDDAAWVLRLAQAQWLAGDKAGHFSTLNGWLKKHPKDVAAQFMLANGYLQLNREDQARSAFARLAELAPDNVLALNNLAWLMRKDNPQKAQEHAERALKLSPDNAAVMDTLGVILLGRGETARALGLLEKAAQKEPQPAIRYHLALAQAKSGSRDAARKTLKTLLDQGGEFPEMKEAKALLAELGG